MTSGADQFDLLDWPALARANQLARERSALQQRLKAMPPRSERRAAFMRTLNRLTREELSLRFSIAQERRK